MKLSNKIHLFFALIFILHFCFADANGKTLNCLAPNNIDIEILINEIYLKNKGAVIPFEQLTSQDFDRLKTEFLLKTLSQIRNLSEKEQLIILLTFTHGEKYHIAKILEKSKYKLTQDFEAYGITEEITDNYSYEDILLKSKVGEIDEEGCLKLHINDFLWGVQKEKLQSIKRPIKFTCNLSHKGVLTRFPGEMFVYSDKPYEPVELTVTNGIVEKLKFLKTNAYDSKIALVYDNKNELIDSTKNPGRWFNSKKLTNHKLVAQLTDKGNLPFNYIINSGLQWGETYVDDAGNKFNLKNEKVELEILNNVIVRAKIINQNVILPLIVVYNSVTNLPEYSANTKISENQLKIFNEHYMDTSLASKGNLNLGGVEWFVIEKYNNHKVRVWIKEGFVDRVDVYRDGVIIDTIYINLVYDENKKTVGFLRKISLGKMKEYKNHYIRYPLISQFIFLNTTDISNALQDKIKIKITQYLPENVKMPYIGYLHIKDGILESFIHENGIIEDIHYAVDEKSGNVIHYFINMTKDFFLTLDNVRIVKRVAGRDDRPEVSIGGKVVNISLPFWCKKKWTSFVVSMGGKVERVNLLKDKNYRNILEKAEGVPVELHSVEYKGKISWNFNIDASQAPKLYAQPENIVDERSFFYDTTPKILESGIERISWEDAQGMISAIITQAKINNYSDLSNLKQVTNLSIPGYGKVDVVTLIRLFGKIQELKKGNLSKRKFFNLVAQIEGDNNKLIFIIKFMKFYDEFCEENLLNLYLINAKISKNEIKIQDAHLEFKNKTGIPIEVFEIIEHKNISRSADHIPFALYLLNNKTFLNGLIGYYSGSLNLIRKLLNEEDFDNFSEIYSLYFAKNETLPLNEPERNVVELIKYFRDNNVLVKQKIIQLLQNKLIPVLDHISRADLLLNDEEFSVFKTLYEQFDKLKTDFKDTDTNSKEFLQEITSLLSFFKEKLEMRNFQFFKVFSAGIFNHFFMMKPADYNEVSNMLKEAKLDLTKLSDKNMIQDLAFIREVQKVNQKLGLMGWKISVMSKQFFADGSEKIRHVDIEEIELIVKLIVDYNLSFNKLLSITKSADPGEQKIVEDINEKLKEIQWSLSEFNSSVFSSRLSVNNNGISQIVEGLFADKTDRYNSGKYFKNLQESNRRLFDLIFFKPRENQPAQKESYWVKHSS